MNNLELNKVLFKLQTRSERVESDDQLVSTFVNVGPLFDTLDVQDHQIIYGRRGTGKTHALRYLGDSVRHRNDVVSYIDVSRLGSDSSIYNNSSLEVGDRATRLLIDVLSDFHTSILDIVTDKDANYDLSIIVPILDRFVDSISAVRVLGEVEEEISLSDSQKSGESSELGTTILPNSFNLSAKASECWEQARTVGAKIKRHGERKYYIHFGTVKNALNAICKFFGRSRIYVLVDEWSVLDANIQPYLADMLRRIMFNIPNVTVKIAAIEHRSKFSIDREQGGYIGIELGADLRAAVNLDEYLVFDENKERSATFFAEFLCKHVNALASEKGCPAFNSPKELISKLFTKINVFSSFVEATEGVPRDAMYIIANAAQKAFDKQISMKDIRNSAYTFFHKDKRSSIDSNNIAAELLEHIIQNVIRDKKTRAFLMQSTKNDKNIDFLFDRRILHILSRNKSSKDHPGIRYLVYKIDYGCYVDLMNTKHYSPGPLFQAGEENVGIAEVPVDDGRSFRRAILDLDDFYKNH